MKLYDFPLAPSPRRVRIFAAEKGIALEKVEVDLRGGGQFAESYRRINPGCVVPALELDDGAVITESMAICRYLEGLQPDPPLLGRTPLEMATVDMWLWRVELQGYQPVTEVLRNRSERFVNRSVPGPAPFAQIAELVERGRERIDLFFGLLDECLAESAYLAGPDFTAADIVALVAIDFAAAVARQTPPPDATALLAWHETVSARPSAAA